VGPGAAKLSVTRPLRVALLTSARTWRGSGVSLGHIAEGLAQRGHLPHLFAGEVPVVDAFAALGFSSAKVATAKTGLREARVLARGLREIGADVLVVDRPRDLRLGALASLAHPLAIVNRYNLSRENPPPDLMSRLAYRRVRLTVFVSETSARQALSRAAYLARRPHRVIAEGVDSARFRPDPDEAEAFRRRHGLEGCRFVIAVGSLTLDKRYDFLLESLAQLGAAAPTLVICGAGSLADPLRARARELSLDVRLLGQIDPDELRGAYNAALCMLHAGAIETFGLSVLEAMACGRAVVAVQGGAVPEVVGDAGLLAPVDDFRGYAAMVQTLLNDSTLRTRLGESARKRATESFSIERMQNAYSEAIESVCFRR
jgi:glycosyltransferase involved in cell wall biosynthesis